VAKTLRQIETRYFHPESALRRFVLRFWDSHCGRRDGRSGEPSANSGPDQFHYNTKILAPLKSVFAKFAEQVRRLARRLEVKIQNEEKQRDARVTNRRRDLEARRNQQIEKLDRNLGEKSEKQTLLKQEFETATKRFNAIESALGRSPENTIGPSVYWSLMGVLSIVEVPVNRLAAEYYFQEAPAISLLIAVAIGLLLLSLAHFSGQFFKRATGARRYQYDTQKKAHGVEPVEFPLRASIFAASVFFISAAGALMYYTAKMRQSYVDLISTESSFNFTDLIAKGQVTSAFSSLNKVPLNDAGYFLLLLNAIIFVFGFTASFLHHEADPAYEV